MVLLLRREAAVDENDLPGQIARPVAGKEHDGLRDLVRLTGATRGHGREETGLGVVAAGKAIEHLRRDRARRHGVDAYAGGRAFERRALRDPFDGVLTARV